MGTKSLKNYPTATLLFALLFCTAQLSAQNSFLLDANIGLSSDQYTSEDFEGFDQLPDGTKLTTGLLVGKEFAGKKIYVQTGVDAVFYSLNAPLVATTHVNYRTRLLTTFQIPLRVHYRIPLVKEKLFLNPGIGYRLGITTGYNQNSVIQHVRDFNTIKPTTLTLSNFDSRTFHMVEANLNLEYALNEKLSLQTTLNYVHGLSQVGDVNWSVSGSGNEMLAGGVQMDGSFAGWTLGIRRYI